MRKRLIDQVNREALHVRFEEDPGAFETDLVVGAQSIIRETRQLITGQSRHSPQGCKKQTLGFASDDLSEEKPAGADLSPKCLLPTPKTHPPSPQTARDTSIKKTASPTPV